MRHLLLLVLLLAACNAPGIHTEPDSGGYECPDAPVVVSVPDPVPCIRVGIALAGHADWLLDVLADGDATKIGAAAETLASFIDHYDECSVELVDEILGH